MKRSAIIPIPKKEDNNDNSNSSDLTPNPRSAESVEKHKQALSFMEEHSKRMTNMRNSKTPNTLSENPISRVIEEKQKINTETTNEKISCKA